MHALRMSILAGAASVTMMASASAADMPGGYAPPVQEFFSTWYLRGDVGYRASDISGGAVFGTFYTDSGLKDIATVGVGIGFKWNWFRSDITVDFGSQPDFIGNTGLVAPSITSVTSKIGNYTALANGYIDIGTWYGITPYVGAGVGFSYFKPISVTITPTATALISVDDVWRFSWAAMVGVSYALSSSLLLDAHYRYLDLGAARTDLIGVGTVNYGDWTAQEFRLGLRYLIP